MAVERDQRLGARLRRRFEPDQVTVVGADLLAVALPRRPYRVVASIPFAITTPLLGRLLDPWHSSLQRAALVVEWGAARRFSARCPGDPRILWWGVRYQLLLARRIDRGSFRPPPQVDAGLLVAERRPVPLVSPSARAHYLGLVVSTHRTPRTPVADALAPIFSNRQLRRLLRDLDLDRQAPVAGLSIEQWASITATMMALVDRHRWPHAKPRWPAR